MEVPPLSQVDLPIRVVWKNLESDGNPCVLEPRELGEGVMAARTLFDGSTFCSAVRVINLSNVKHKVTEGMCLGDAQEVLVHDPLTSVTSGDQCESQSDNMSAWLDERGQNSSRHLSRDPGRCDGRGAGQAAGSFLPHRRLCTREAKQTGNCRSKVRSSLQER